MHPYLANNVLLLTTRFALTLFYVYEYNKMKNEKREVSQYQPNLCIDTFASFGLAGRGTSGVFFRLEPTGTSLGVLEFNESLTISSESQNSIKSSSLETPPITGLNFELKAGGVESFGFKDAISILAGFNFFFLSSFSSLIRSLADFTSTFSATAICFSV